ncbi:unnamed protein product, partial [Ectocarpus sp. 12 AP-2014]
MLLFWYCLRPTAPEGPRSALVPPGPSRARYISAIPFRKSSMYAALASCDVDAAFLGGGCVSRHAGVVGEIDDDKDRSCSSARSWDSRRFAAHFAAASLLRLAKLIAVIGCRVLGLTEDL